MGRSRSEDDEKPDKGREITGIMEKAMIRSVNRGIWGYKTVLFSQLCDIKIKLGVVSGCSTHLNLCGPLACGG